MMIFPISIMAFLNMQMNFVSTKLTSVFSIIFAFSRKLLLVKFISYLWNIHTPKHKIINELKRKNSVNYGV
jgi:hypothetical protein